MWKKLILLFSVLTVSFALSAQVPGPEETLKKGVAYLLRQQESNGSFQNNPAFTALAAIALFNSRTPEGIQGALRARPYILSCANNDGSFSGPQKQYLNYTTSVCLSALGVFKDKDDFEQIRKTRNYLKGTQLTEDNKEHPTDKDSPAYGGIGYGKGGPARPDLSNTQLALEALYDTEFVDTEVNGGTEADRKGSDLAWKNALCFLKSVQNMPKDADEHWVASSDKPEQDGGFVYLSGESKATEKYKSETLSSYGSMTYAGLKSMIYAHLTKDDFRVKAAADWAAKHYTLDENPGMGPEGHYYYLQTFAKALAVLGEKDLKTAGGNRDWRKDLIEKLCSLQKADGSWVNANGRWMESIPMLTTAYSLIALEYALFSE